MDSLGVNGVQLGPPAAQDQLSVSFRLGTNLNIGTRGRGPHSEGRFLEVHDRSSIIGDL